MQLIGQGPPYRSVTEKVSTEIKLPEIKQERSARSVSLWAASILTTWIITESNTHLKELNMQKNINEPTVHNGNYTFLSSSHNSLDWTALTYPWLLLPQVLLCKGNRGTMEDFEDGQEENRAADLSTVQSNAHVGRLKGVRSSHASQHVCAAPWMMLRSQASRQMELDCYLAEPKPSHQ